MSERPAFRQQHDRLPRFDAIADIDHAQMLCDEHLMRLYDPDEATQWWHAHHPVLDGVPNILIKHHPQKVMDYIFSLRTREAHNF